MPATVLANKSKATCLGNHLQQTELTSHSLFPTVLRTVSGNRLAASKSVDPLGTPSKRFALPLNDTPVNEAKRKKLPGTLFREARFLVIASYRILTSPRPLFSALLAPTLRLSCASLGCSLSYSVFFHLEAPPMLPDCRRSGSGASMYRAAAMTGTIKSFISSFVRGMIFSDSLID